MKVIAAAVVSFGLTFGLGQLYLASSEACMEDQACWDCTSMGNRICGEEIE